jgi:polyphosphate kinase 2 (PPK2 family)
LEKTGGIMKIKSEDFRVREGCNVNLKRWPTFVKPVYKSKEEYQSILAEHVRQMSQLQNLYYASNKNALLLIFQGMDSAGKDGTIKVVEFIALNILQLLSSNMIFCGEQHENCRNEDRSVFSIDLIMKRY